MKDYRKSNYGTVVSEAPLVKIVSRSNHIEGVSMIQSYVCTFLYSSNVCTHIPHGTGLEYVCMECVCVLCCAHVCMSCHTSSDSSVSHVCPGLSLPVLPT